MERVFFHGTTRDRYDEWTQIGAMSSPRAIYLTPHVTEAVMYMPEGDDGVLLRVAYDPEAPWQANNWTEGSWQHREYKPILLVHTSRVAQEIALQIRSLVRATLQLRPHLGPEQLKLLNDGVQGRL